MRWSEYVLATPLFWILGSIFALFPFRRRRIVLASARSPMLEGNLAAIHRAILDDRPDAEIVLLLEPYSYRLWDKLSYLARLIRGTYYLWTSGLVILDNAWFPVHVRPHRPETTVVQVWHAAGALKRFGLDAPAGDQRAEQAFLHRYYDYAIVSGETSRAPFASALRTPVEHVLPTGAPRTDFFFDPTAMSEARHRLLARYPQLRGRTVILYAPTFRGRGEEKHPAPGFDAARLRSLLSDEYALVLKTHPSLDSTATASAGYDVIADPHVEINELFTLTDILVTDYSSSILEWALLRRPLLLMVPDLAAYEADPGLYLDYRTDMIGTQVTDTDAAAAAIVASDFDLASLDAFVARHLEACDGQAAQRLVERFGDASARRARLPADGDD